MENSHLLPFLWMRGESEEIIRTEMGKIHEAGIGAVCLEARPHPDFAGEGWWHDVDIVIEEAKKYQMQVYILDDAHFPTGMANGGMKKHPELCRRFLVSQYVDVTGPLPYAEVDVDLLTKRKITWMDLGKEITKPLYAETRVLSVTLCRIADHDTIEGLPVDVTDHVQDGRLRMDIPAGTYRIRVNFVTTDFGAKPDYINYIDHDSVHVLIDEVYEKHYEHYGPLFGSVIAGFFSDEPAFYNTDDYGPDNKIGLEMPLPWGAELETRLRERLGDDFLRDLPLLFANEKNGKQQAIRTAYMDIVSALYEKNFCVQLGDWCRQHGVMYIGHVVEDNKGHKRLGAGVGHYFRAVKGQDMAGIDNIGFQVVPGNDVAMRHSVTLQDPDFYHYQQAKLGASSAAIDPAHQGRLLCENFGAYGWRLGVRDMKWLVDFLVCQGVNYFTPHAFSMAEYPDDDAPPHFYARGNNPQFPFFCDLMRYTDRLCRLFDGGAGVPDVGVLYEAESDWAGKAMDGYVVGKALLPAQIDFLFLPDEVFGKTTYYGAQQRGKSLFVNGREMKALVIPEVEYLPENTARFIAANPDLPVFYLEHYPKGICGAVADEDELLAQATRNRECVPVAGLVQKLGTLGISSRAKTPAKDLRTYHYRKEGKDIFFFQNVSLSETVQTSYRLPEGGKWLCYDAMADVYHPADVRDDEANLCLAPYGSLVLVQERQGGNHEEGYSADDKKEVSQQHAADVSSSFLPLQDFTVTLHEIGGRIESWAHDPATAPVSNKRPLFAGTICYETTFNLETVPAAATFFAEHVYECMEVTVNGQKLPHVITPPYQLDITHTLRQGENTIKVLVATTALRNANQKPGIFGPEWTVMEPTGMFGKIGITEWRRK